MSDERIRVELERTGGFGGLITHRVVDTADLPPQQAADLRGLIAGAELDAAGDAAARATVPVPDAYHYRLTVVGGGRRWDLSLSDPQVPPSLRPLLRAILAAGPTA